MWAHLLDVANAAHLLAERLPSPLQREIAAELGLRTWNQAKPLLALLIGLHDMGKAIPTFQGQHKPTAEALAGAGLPFPTGWEQRRQHHGHASIPILHQWIETRAPLDAAARPMLRALTAFAGFHHGRIDPKKHWKQKDALGRGAWQRAQQTLLSYVATAWMKAHGGWPDLSGAPASPYGLPFPSALLAFAGWTTLADWVGSMAEHMPDVTASDNLDAYILLSKKGVQAASDKAHLSSGSALQAEHTQADFERCFPETFGAGSTATPHPLQTLAAKTKLPDKPALVLIEAPTGEGKTEAAFYLAARLQARRADGRGVYVALPTQATSNGLFPRFRDFLAEAHNSAAGPANVLLAHGASGLNLDLERLLEPDDHDEADRAAVYAARWFLPSKRSLLAPYGVGTVDQALMGSITSRHFFLRLYGLAGKTVIFDEVHAYDGYMSALFARLLQWLRHVGADVVILTATLPRATRRALLQAWDAPDVPDPDAYPVLAVAEAETEGRLTSFDADFETSQSAQALLVFGDSTPSEIARRVAAAVRQRATVGVVLNRVDRVQEVFEHIQALGLDADLHLLHARFPFAERQRCERDVMERFGKHERRASLRPAVLVATQVAEQSLDLDVDLMLSDLAPIDLLLQRAGRLHRHNIARPPGFERPQLVVLRPPLRAPHALPDVSGIGGQFRPDNPEGIYLDLPLFRTDLTLRRWVADCGGWSLPADYRPLIESVYSDEADQTPDDLDAADADRWKLAVKAKDDLRKSLGQHARTALVPEPSNLRELVADGLGAKRTRYDEDDDTPARDLKPQTRIGGPSVQAVCLHRRDERYFLDVDHQQELPPGPKLSPGEIRAVLRQAVRLSRRGVVRHLQEHIPSVPGWEALAKKTPALAYHRPLVFEKTTAPVGDTLVELHPTLGIRYNPTRP